MISKRKLAKKGTELGEKRRSQTDEAQVKLRGSSEGDLLCAWRMRLIKNIANSGWKVKGGLEKFQKEDLFFPNSMELEALKEFIRYPL